MKLEDFAKYFTHITILYCVKDYKKYYTFNQFYVNNCGGNIYNLTYSMNPKYLLRLKESAQLIIQCIIFIYYSFLSRKKS